MPPVYIKDKKKRKYFGGGIEMFGHCKNEEIISNDILNENNSKIVLVGYPGDKDKVNDMYEMKGHIKSVIKV